MFFWCLWKAAEADEGQSAGVQEIWSFWPWPRSKNFRVISFVCSCVEELYAQKQFMCCRYDSMCNNTYNNITPDAHVRVIVNIYLFLFYCPAAF